ncbi:hypothetical protein ABWK43_29830 [Bacillus thuringiensis]|uniref:hypothetical protein n=1 Tax=Bacillus thuringiensis TaxID=1428 RepID=UPI003396A0C0
MSKTLFNISEQQLVETSEMILNKKGFQTFKEVPLFSSSIDMIVIKDQTINAIEFKLRNWKKAVQQVLRHSICVDYMYVCVPRFKKEETRENIEQTVLLHGVGLFYFYYNENDEAILEEKIKPQKSRTVWEKKKSDLMTTLMK